MSLQHDVVVVLLGCTVACCWVGALGMWKMPTPTQSLHYLSLPCSLGIVLLAAAVVVQEGFGQVGLKTIADCRDPAWLQYRGDACYGQGHPHP